MSVDGFVLDYRPNGKEAVAEAYRRYQEALKEKSKNPAYLAGIELGECVAVDLKRKIESEGRSLGSMTWDELQQVIENHWKGEQYGKIIGQDYASSAVMWNVLTCFWKYGMYVCVLKAKEAARIAEQVERNSGGSSSVAKEWRKKEMRWGDLADPGTRGVALVEIWKTV